MKGTHIGVVILSLMAIFSLHPAHSATPSTADASTELPEVVVESKRLYQLRKEMIQVEDKFYALYNKLNTDQEFDVHCTMHTPTGTHLQERVCRVRFYEDAQAAWARSQITGDYSPPPDLVALERAPEYKRNALSVINAHPELRRLVKEREALEKRYLATRKKRFKGHWFGL
jgi:hypothetical protein